MSGEASDATSPAVGVGANPLVDAIVERFGGIRPMAAKLGIPVTTVQGWKKRGHIPPNRRVDLEAAAARLGIPLASAELDAVMGAPEPSAPAPVPTAVIALPGPDLAPPSEPRPTADRPFLGADAAKTEPAQTASAKTEPREAAPPRMELPKMEPMGAPRLEIPRPDAARTSAAGPDPVRREPPRPTPRPARGGAVSALALLVSLVAVAAGGYSLWRGGALDPVLTRAGLAPANPALGPSVQSVEQVGTQATLAEMARRLTMAAQHQQALEQEVADLKAKLAALPAPTAAPTADGALAAPDPALATRLEQMTDQFNRLTERQRALEQALAQSAQQREELTGRLAAQTASAGRGQALLVATNQLQAALLSGQPYGVELSAVRGLAPEDGALGQALDRLAQSQATGLIGPVALREGFDRAATAAQQAARVPEGADWLERLWGRIKALVTIRRKDGRMEGNAPDAVVSRAGAALDRGDVGTAVAEMSALSGPPAATPEVQAWLRDAQARLGADDAMTRLSRRAVSDVQAGLPPPKDKPVAPIAPDKPVESVSPPDIGGNPVEGKPEGGQPDGAATLPPSPMPVDGGHP
ncbi:COG4223 family protein [Nitrospirillum iridis]|uniref:Inner membrane protein n=1 Tax=Nitrospirillum iridis TaxID=765888 RepID=A0A7X0EGE6_9PROT|nr:mitofilin family membrane protein [Nitrospirillum iridis]MBB6254041.1 hypothetical protein [Nitrospirillum iridis]